MEGGVVNHGYVGEPARALRPPSCSESSGYYSTGQFLFVIMVLVYVMKLSGQVQWCSYLTLDPEAR
jgi:hypothetical protein